MSKNTVAQQAKTANLLPSRTGILQRKCACGSHSLAGGECAECAKKKTDIQRMLAVGASNDPLEQEADRVADQVLATQRHPTAGGAPLRIQRFSGNPTGETEAPAIVDRVLAGSGRPLNPELRHDMEQRFGHDFSQVRVHAGAAAEQSARDVNAHAYTVGRNIVFGARQVASGAHEWRSLLAHELTHVVQQTRGGASCYIARKLKSWPAWHQEELAAIARIAGPSDGKPADIRWSTMVTYLCRLPKDRAQSLRNRLAPDAPGMLAGTDDFAVYVQKKFPIHHKRLIAVLQLLNQGQKPTECEAPKHKQESKEMPKKQPQTESKPDLPRGANAIDDCTTTQRDSVRKAISRALSDLDAATSMLEKRPLSDHAKNALFIIYRASDDATGDSVIGHLRRIRAGLPNAPIVCDQPGDILTGCSGEDIAYTNMITGKIHLCMKAWDQVADPDDAYPRILIHEAAHAFLHIFADSYFGHTCLDSESTIGFATKTRLGLADSPACVNHHLTHRASGDVKFTKELQSGESLKSISSPHGPISLGGNPAKPYFLLLRAPHVGFTFRWRLYDDADRHYLLQNQENGNPLDWFAFTNVQNSIIGRKTRDLLAKRDVTNGVIECTARIPNAREKTLRLDLKFVP